MTSNQGSIQQTVQMKTCDASLERILEQAQRTAHTDFADYKVVSGSAKQDGIETYVLFVVQEGRDQKYLQLLDQGRQYLVSLPIQPFDYHYKIHDVVSRALGAAMTVPGGGWTELCDGAITLYGSSGDYGPADHEEMAKAMTAAGVPARG